LRFGDTLFILGSVITFAFALFNMVESRAHWKDYANAEREDRIEFWETLMFFLAGCVFLAGSIFYWPGIFAWWYQGQTETYINDAEEHGEGVGAYCFVSGSTLFLIASMFNAIGLGMNKEEAEENRISVITHYIHVVALMCSQCGSVLFVAGSLMYRPGVGGSCADYNARYEGAAQVGEVAAAHACVSTGTFGTNLYIYGSVLYLIESLLGFVNSILKGSYLADDDKVGHKTVEEEVELGTELMDES